jgi:hypothetical protein
MTFVVPCHLERTAAIKPSSKALTGAESKDPEEASFT